MKSFKPTIFADVIDYGAYNDHKNVEFFVDLLDPDDHNDYRHVILTGIINVYLRPPNKIQIAPASYSEEKYSNPLSSEEWIALINEAQSALDHYWGNKLIYYPFTMFVFN